MIGKRELDWCRIALLLGAIVASGCADDSTAPDRRPVTLATAPGDGVPTLKLSHALNELHRRAEPIDTLAADLELGGATSDLLHVTDVAALDGGRFAVLDMLAVSIHLYGRDGGLVRRLGSEGPGPAQFRRPRALARVGDDLVVWDKNGSKAFTVLSLAGEVIGTTAVPFDGDWMALQLRGVRHRYDPPWPQSIEDLTRRLDGFGPDHFVYQVQPDEMLAAVRRTPLDFAAPPVHVVRFGRDAGVVDTVAASVAPPNLERPVRNPDAYPHYNQPIFSPRPVWTTGDGWIALGHGDSTGIDVRSSDGRALLRIEWPRSGGSITERDRFVYADWLIQEEVTKSGDESAMSQVSSPDDRQRAREKIAHDLWPYAEHRPQIQAAYGVGHCLWLSGFVPADYPDGTSLTWLAVNLVRRTVEAVVRIPRLGSRVRDIARDAIFTSYVDYDWTHRLERYPLPAVDCRARDATLGRAGREPARAGKR